MDEKKTGEQKTDEQIDNEIISAFCAEMMRYWQKEPAAGRALIREVASAETIGGHGPGGLA